MQTDPALDLARLKALAEPIHEPDARWEVDAPGCVALVYPRGGKETVAVCGGGHTPSLRGKAFAAYIAALDPATVLALIARAERAEELEAKIGRDSDIPLEELERNQTDECWTCKIGDVRRSNLPDGSDLPMRNAVLDAFYSLTGRKPRAIFSGWGKRWRETELAVIENRMPRGKEPKEPT